MKSSAVYGSIARLGETICTRQDLYKYLTMHFFYKRLILYLCKYTFCWLFSWNLILIVFFYYHHSYRNSMCGVNDLAGENDF